MKVLILYLFVVSSLCSITSITLNINNIFISEGKNDLKKSLLNNTNNQNTILQSKNVFNVSLLSDEYYEEENYKKIRLKCNLYNLIIPIQCFLMENLTSNFKGPYHLNENELEKSFLIELNGDTQIINIEISKFFINIFKKKEILNLINDKNYIQIEFSSKKKDNKIYIAMSLDNNYIYPTIVSITSIMENSSKENKYIFYIMHPDDFSEINKKKLKSIEKKYNYICIINFLNMGNKYQGLNLKKDTPTDILTTPAYYRLSLSDLLPKVDKIIWLDGDTLTLIDLKEMFDLNMENYYYKGYRVWSRQCIDKFVDNYICSGVLLINLKELRENNITRKFNELIQNHKDELQYHDETVINYICGEKNGILPPKYGTLIRYKLEEGIYLEKEKLEALKYPGVLHLMDKPWKDNKALKLYGSCKWWEYAKKSDFYDEIDNAFPIVIIENEKKNKRFKKWINKLFKLFKK